jgi:hypothetical protein
MSEAAHPLEALAGRRAAGAQMLPWYTAWSIDINSTGAPITSMKATTTPGVGLLAAMITQFIDKVRDVVGLYLDPPERAVVLCVDEKSQIQALDRTAPILPLLPGVPERATHDYKRHGTSSLYAALDIVTGKVIGSPHSRHRAIEFRKFLATIDRRSPTGSTST